MDELQKYAIRQVDALLEKVSARVSNAVCDGERSARQRWAEDAFEHLNQARFLLEAVVRNVEAISERPKFE